MSDDELGGRYFREARFFLAGDKVVAQSHILEARSLMGYMRDQHAMGGPAIQVRYAALSDGTMIRATMMNGQYQAQIFSVTPDTEQLHDDQIYVYVVSAVDSLLRIFSLGDLSSPAGVYGMLGSLEPPTWYLPTYRKLDTVGDERFCKYQFGMGQYGHVTVPWIRPDNKSDLGPETGFHRYCVCGYSYVGLVALTTTGKRTTRVRARKRIDTLAANPILAATHNHSAAEVELEPYRQSITADGSQENQTVSWFDSVVGDVSVVYFRGQFPRDQTSLRNPTQVEADAFCFQVFAGKQNDGLEYSAFLGHQDSPVINASSVDIPLVDKSPWYTSIPASSLTSTSKVWGAPVDNLFKINAAHTRASILLYSPAVYAAISGSTPPIGVGQVVHLDISGTRDAPVFDFVTDAVGQDTIAADYVGDTFVTVEYPAFSTTAGLTPVGSNLTSSDGWLNEPSVCALHDLDIRYHACLFSTATGSGSARTITTYFKYGANSIAIESDAVSFSYTGSAPIGSLDPLPMFSTNYSPLPASSTSGEQAGPSFLLLGANSALIFVRPMYLYLRALGYVGHCQILLYSKTMNSLTDVTAQLIPNAGDMAYSDMDYPPWLDIGFIDKVSAKLGAVPTYP